MRDIFMFLMLVTVINLVAVIPIAFVITHPYVYIFKWEKLGYWEVKFNFNDSGPAAYSRSPYLLIALYKSMMKARLEGK